MEHSIGNDRAILDALPRRTAPVVAINPGYRPTDFDALERHGVKASVMAGVGHFLMMEDPETFNRLLGETIEDFVGGSGSAG
jgi:pimeloyl-ACP methyl ester carboxylesterase